MKQKWYLKTRLCSCMAVAMLPAMALAQHDQHAEHNMSNMPDMDMATDKAMMPAMLGSYTMMREASGTSWQPDSSPMNGLHFAAGAWSLMAHGTVTGVYDYHDGPRGDSLAFSQSMFMLMGNRDVGSHGRLGLRAMLSLDALMGKPGYPLLLATGETADGVTGLVDR
jgi:roadblock/LC7 domain-containing protein